MRRCAVGCSTAGTGTAEAFVISKNLARRHLMTNQRAAIAAELANMSQGRPIDSSVKAPNGAFTVSQREAADLMGVSRRSVQRAAVVMETDPEAHEAAKRGDQADHRRGGGREVEYDVPALEPLVGGVADAARWASPGRGGVVRRRGRQPDLGCAGAASLGPGEALRSLGRPWGRRCAAGPRLRIQVQGQRLQRRLSGVNRTTWPGVVSFSL